MARATLSTSRVRIRVIGGVGDDDGIEDVARLATVFSAAKCTEAVSGSRQAKRSERSALAGIAMNDVLIRSTRRLRNFIDHDLELNIVVGII